MESIAILLILCITRGITGLDSSKFEEAGCANAKPAANVKTDFITKLAAWHIPMGSAYFYNQWVEKITNKSATADQLSNLCLKYLFLAASNFSLPYIIAAGALNQIMTYECVSPTLETQNCNAIPGTLTYAPGVESEETIIKTDNASYVIIVQCIRKKLKSWYVITSTGNEPSAEVKKDVLQAVTALGFDKKHSSMIRYDKCPKPKA